MENQVSDCCKDLLACGVVSTSIYNVLKHLRDIQEKGSQSNTTFRLLCDEANTSIINNINSFAGAQVCKKEVLYDSIWYDLC